MPNKNYQRGFSAEKRCQEELSKEGYWTQRAYGSKGAWDVIAVNEILTRLIEVKRSKRNILKLSSIAHQYREVIEKFNAIPNGAIKELWVWIDKQGVVGDARYQPARWERFQIVNQCLVREVCANAEKGR